MVVNKNTISLLVVTNSVCKAIDSGGYQEATRVCVFALLVLGANLLLCTKFGCQFVVSGASVARLIVSGASIGTQIVSGASIARLIVSGASIAQITNLHYFCL